jgi:hypothetical protein
MALDAEQAAGLRTSRRLMMRSPKGSGAPRRPASATSSTPSKGSCALACGPMRSRSSSAGTHEGRAINGSAIYNDREGGNVAVDAATGTVLSFDAYGAHSRHDDRERGARNLLSATSAMAASAAVAVPATSSRGGRRCGRGRIVAEPGRGCRCRE